MSRFADRIRANGCRPVNAGDLDRRRPELPVVQELFGGGDLELGRRRATVAVQEASKHSASEVFDGRRLDDDVIVVVADGAAAYLATFTDVVLSDLVATVAPPFNRFFVEFALQGDRMGMRSAGVLFETLRNPRDEEPGGDVGWIVHAELLGEWRKGECVGPLCKWMITLGPDGTIGQEDGTDVMAEIPHIEWMTDEERDEWNLRLNMYLFAALFAVSLMHCKNVDVEEVEPPERLSKRNQQRHGTPLVSYRVLEVGAMTRTLDRDGRSSEVGLGGALHICRGHFKTFTEDAPLFGSRTGTYWWADHVRGDAALGQVDKSYKVQVVDGQVGRAYERAHEHVELDAAAEHRGVDPDAGGRGLRAHAHIQNTLADVVTDAGWEPRRPKPDEPQYDLAWDDGVTVTVVEVKSLTPANEERQLRLALGQVQRYVQQLDAVDRNVRGAIAVETAPTDSTWVELCAEKGIVLTWPEGFTATVTPR